MTSDETRQTSPPRLSFVEYKFTILLPLTSASAEEKIRNINFAVRLKQFCLIGMAGNYINVLKSSLADGIADENHTANAMK